MKDGVPSRTSLFVARIILTLGGDAYGRSFLPAGCLETQVQFLKAARLVNFPWLLCNPVVSKLVRWFFHFHVINMIFIEGVGYRKKWIENFVRDTITTGQDRVSQVLVIAAGYDMLAWRLAAEYPKLRFFELDHPATSNVKMEGLKQMGIPPNMQLIQADLTKTTLENALLDSSSFRYNKDARTIVIMEGLLFYLSEGHVKELFRSVSKVVGSGSNVVFDFFGWNDKLQCVDMGPNSTLLHAMLRYVGEPMLWGMDPTNLEAFFAGTPWKLCTEIGAVGCEKLAAVRKLR